MSFRRKVLGIGAALLAASCASPESPPDEPTKDSESRIALRASIGPEFGGTEVVVTADDSVIVRATVVGRPDLYEAPALTVNDTTAVTMRPDGSAFLLRAPGTLTFSATAKARSVNTRPALLVASGKFTPVCLAYAAAGINLAVRDSIAGVAVSGPGAMRLHATNGTASDSLRSPTLIASWATAWERPGTWTVSIDAEGYRPWQQSGLVVTKGLCHVRPIAVTARLQRQ
jgi:hypothetical protein